MPADLGLGAVLVVVAIAAGAFAQSLSGFGFSLVAAPVCSVVLGPLQGIRAAAALAVVVDLLVLARERRRLDGSVLVRLLVPAVAVMPIAFVVLRVVPGRLLVGVGGATTLACVALMALPALAGSTSGGRGDWVWAGMASGAMGVTAGLAGPPVALQALRGPQPVTHSRATLAAFFLVVDLGAVAARGLTPPGRGVAVLLGVGLVGFAAGLAAARRVPDRVVRAGVLALAGGAGCLALTSAVMA